MAAAAAQSPLASPTLCLTLHESSGEQVKLYVSGAVLEKMPYFTTRLSSRWRETRESVDLRLPDGCTAAALTLLLERLHFPGSELSGLSLSLALQVVQLATMLLADDDALLVELKQLLREALRSPGDIETFKAFCCRIQPPTCIAEVLSGFERTPVMSMMSTSWQAELLRHALVSGDDVACAIIETAIKKGCHTGGADAIATNARVLADLLKRGRAPNRYTDKDAGYLTYVWSRCDHGTTTFMEAPSAGLPKVLSLTSRFAFAYPEYFASLVPLMFPQTRCAQVMDNRGADGISVARVLMSALFELLDSCFTGDSWEFTAKDFESVFATLAKHGHLELLREAPGRMRFADFLQRAPVDVKIAACHMLCEAGTAAAAKIVSCQMLDSLPDANRQMLCMVLVPRIGYLDADVKAAVHAEVRAGMALGEEEEAQGLQPKRRRGR
mmetsp:Transcript_108719/g.318072  ORF Transcript_108719/g.318072 Transcript_108719/m.318072 type:complete len:441 (+) Transcript_108719:86-1408(+)